MQIRRPRASTLATAGALLGYTLAAVLRSGAMYRYAYAYPPDPFPHGETLWYMAGAARRLGGPSDGILLAAIAAVAAMAGAVLLGRAAARVRLRVAGVDPLEGVRRELPRALRVALVAVPAVIVSAVATSDLIHEWDWLPGGWGRWVSVAAWLPLAVVLPVHGVALFGRHVLLRWLRRPLLDAEERAIIDAPERGRNAEGFTFSAVAVTREARFAVASFAALSLAFAAVLARGVSIPANPHTDTAVIVYVVLAVAGAAAYARASRIALGFDGVRIGGTSRTRFFAYRDLDGVEERGHEIVLQAHGRAVVRLQLHGRDAGLRGAIVERLRAAIEAARAPAGGAVRMLAESASAATLAHAARGDGSYRAQGATREQLWEVVETANADGVARARAARALSAGRNQEDLTRLRAAAERCAEPETRAVLEGLAEADAEAEEEERGAGDRLRRVREGGSV